MRKPALSAVPVLVFLSMVVIAPVVALLSLGDSFPLSTSANLYWRDAYIRQVLGFSIWQAFLSVTLSLSLALLVARAFIHSSEFAGKQAILQLFGLPLVIPSVVAVFGIVSVYGSQGWIPLGRELYGLNGILIAHVFFNMPLAVRLLLPVWGSIPEAHWRIARQLSLNSLQQWRHLEWPMIREVLPGIALLLFMLCLTSFAVVLTLGGGPGSTTLEVAIYQSLRFDFEPEQAVFLALLQFGLCATIALAALFLQKMPEVDLSLQASPTETNTSHPVGNILIVLLAAIFVCLPILSMLVDGARGEIIEVMTGAALWRAAALSLMIALLASSLCVIATWLLLDTTSDLYFIGRGRLAGLCELAGMVIYVIPPLVIGTGLFVLLGRVTSVFDWAIPLVVIINAVMGLPFALKTMGPEMRRSKLRYQRLCENLDLGGWHRFRIVDWPVMRQSTGFAMALVAVLAIGDLGVIALFGTPGTTTLPLMLYHQLGAYLMSEAAVTAVFLLVICLVVFRSMEYLVGGRRHA